MIDDDGDSDNNAEEAPSESLGIRLRHAREAKGLGIDAVAHQLNLSQQRVFDMENDEYRFAGAETYAKGYLRSYARLLGLDPDTIVRDFDRLHYTDTIQRHETKFIAKRQVSAGDRPMRWVTYSIGIILVVLVAIWWRSQPSHSDNPGVVAEAADQATTDITPQSLHKSEVTEGQPAEALGEGVGLLQKSEQPSAVIDPTSPAQAKEKSGDAEQTTKAEPKTTSSGGVVSEGKNRVSKVPDSSAAVTTPSSAKTPAIEASATAGKASTTSKPVTPPSAASPATVTAPAKKPAADEGDDDESDDSEDSDTDSTADTKKQSWNHTPSFSAKRLLGQRGQDERALLQQLDTILARG